MKGLIEILNKFDAERDKRVVNGKWVNDADRKDEAVAECFYPCAKEILCNGYFLVNNKYIIDLGAIELYYHEEGEGDDKIRDYAMYHISERYQKPKTTVFQMEKNENEELPYFKFGSFNLHQSGVDVTFEKEDEGKKYRASFLIRAYRVFAANDKDLKTKLQTSIGFDNCSTHIFDDMFYMGISFFDNDNTTIDWVKCTGKCSDEPTQCPRVNIVKCVYDNVNKKVCKKPYEKEDYQKNTNLYTLKNGQIYKQDLRPWQFTRINNKKNEDKK